MTATLAHDVASPVATLVLGLVVSAVALVGGFGEEGRQLARRALRLSRRADAEAVASITDCGSTHAAHLSVQP